jgi:hypothetical protein
MFAVEILDRGHCRGNRAQALAQWRHSVASNEALDVLHQAMCPASYRHIRMVIKITSNLLAFFVSSSFIAPTTVDNKHIWST